MYASTDKRTEQLGPMCSVDRSVARSKWLFYARNSARIPATAECSE